MKKSDWKVKEEARTNARKVLETEVKRTIEAVTKLADKLRLAECGYKYDRQNKKASLAEAALWSLRRIQGEIMKPSIGRIVHFTATPSGYPIVFAAIITALNNTDDTRVSLHIFARDESGSYPCDYDNVQFTEHSAGTTEAIGKWSWPARV